MTLKNRGPKVLSLAAAAALGAGVLATPAAATNGYFANGYSVQSKGMAGSGVAVETGVMGLANNPALGTRLGRQFDMCASGFNPDRSTTISPGGPLVPGTFKSKNPWFLVPCLGVNLPQGDRASLSFMLYGNGGMNTEYTTNFLGFGVGSSPLGVNLEQLFVSANYAIELDDGLTVGVAPILAFQRFSATGLEAFGGVTVDPTSLTGRGDDWSNGFGVNLGVTWEPNEQVTFGASYRSEIDMSKFKKYAGLYANGGDFDIPATATIGVAVKPASQPGLTVTAELQRIFYGDVPAIANSAAPPGGPLGSPTGYGFGWVDMDVIRLGAAYQVDNSLTLRAGVSRASDFITNPGEVIFNTLAPATPEWHLSFGATKQLNNGWTLDLAYTHAFDKSYSGANPFMTGVAQNASIRMDQHEFAFGLSKTW